MARMKIRARAVDMLGKQQVAGIPTAISELFKNAHDAYAKRVEVDYYRTRDLFILRDDGVGMSRDDFEQRWLTVGTESKLDEDGGLCAPPVDPDQPVRPVMGEKGIGRLAIAVIGPQVLVLTRPKIGNVGGSLTAAYVNWRLFGLPGIDLADIEIPIREFAPGDLPDPTVINEMLGEVRNSLAELAGRVPNQLLIPIQQDLDTFSIDPRQLAERLPSGPDLRGNGYGVHFYIQPSDPILADDIDGHGEDVASPLQKVLIGFSNTMTPDHADPPIRAHFRDHLPNGLVNERMAGENFFTPEEFESADHHISGDIDAFGQFSGTVNVYKKRATAYRVPWRNVGGKPTLCGPFSINFAYIQGKASESRMDPDDWRPLYNKAQKIGGLYIYRDGIRILPYGDSDYDFINIERRRTLKASYYFFSYRRMFGVINVSKESNSNLVEKAGREGFQENKAYRQFKDILENLFVQLAADFFREDSGGPEAEEFLRLKAAIVKADALRKKRADQIRGRRAALGANLDAFFTALNQGNPESEISALIREAKDRLNGETPNSIDAEALFIYERDLLGRLQKIDEKYRLSKPRGFGLSKTMAHQWARYEVERARLFGEVFGRARTELAELLQHTTDRLGLRLDARKRVVTAVEETALRERKRTKSLHTDVRKQMQGLQTRVLGLTKYSLSTVEETIRNVLADLEGTDTSDLSENDLSELRERFEQTVARAAEEQSALLEKLRDQLKLSATEEGLDQEEIVGALEDELEMRRDRDFESLQLAQMGMAIGIVHHEFQAVITAVRENLRRLKLWADRNPQLAKLYDEIRESYAHLDGYLSLFAPLNRRLRRQRMLISGSDILDYLTRLLGDRMSRHAISLSATDDFMASEVDDFVSTIYPSFVNLIDNAIYWLNQRGSSWIEGGAIPGIEDRPKEVKLDFFDGAYVISDNGPGILSQDHDIVFQAGFSRKPMGSGLGLYITKNLLERSGYRLELDPHQPGVGATFRVFLPNATTTTSNEDEPNDSDS